MPQHASHPNIPPILPIPVNRLSCNEPLPKPGLMAQIVLHSDKADRVYMPLQRAFIREVERQFARNGSDKAATLMRYMLGTHDYYKVYKHNSTMSIESFNMDATLSWGKQVPMPKALVRIAMKPGSKTTSLMVLDQGWQLSFRLHSAESLVKRSLKFDVQVIGQPPRLTRHELHYR